MTIHASIDCMHDAARNISFLTGCALFVIITLFLFCFLHLPAVVRVSSVNAKSAATVDSSHHVTQQQALPLLLTKHFQRHKVPELLRDERNPLVRCFREPEGKREEAVFPYILICRTRAERNNMQSR